MPKGSCEPANSWQRGKGKRRKTNHLWAWLLLDSSTADGRGLRDSSFLRLSISQETIKEKGRKENGKRNLNRLSCHCFIPATSVGN